MSSIMCRYSSVTPCSLQAYVGNVSRRWLHDVHPKMSAMFPVIHGSSKDGTKQSKEGVRSQQIMSRSGMIYGASAGTFMLLPMSTRALEKLCKVIDAQMQSLGAHKITMPCMAPALQWKTTGRWEEMGSELLKLKDRHGSEHCLAPTHEEAVTSLVAAFGPISYKDLPIKLYQIGRKFRDEMRPKNGLLRCREFEMKDLYTFHASEEDARETYDSVCQSYIKIFERLKLDHTKVAGDVGAMGGLKSHEFHILSDVGEDTILNCSKCQKSFNKEMIGPELCDRPDCTQEFFNSKGIEISHAFLLGTRYSSVLNAVFTAADSQTRPLLMGCYGIGVTRLLAAAVEVLSTPDNKLRWPTVIAPYQVCIIPQSSSKRSASCDHILEQAAALQSRLSMIPALRSEVILDDRQDMSIGYRIKQADMKGFPFVVILGKKSQESPAVYELKDIYQDQTDFVNEEDLIHRLTSRDIVPLL